MASAETLLQQQDEKAAADHQAHIQETLDLATAGLSTPQAQQVTVTVHDALKDGTLTEEDIHHAKLEAQAADAALLHSHELHHEQAVAVETGDFNKGAELAGNAEYDLKVADSHGAGAAHPTIDAQIDRQHNETQHLETAKVEQETSVAYQQDATANIQTGYVDNAEQSTYSAIDHAHTANAHADAGDGGGSHTAPATTDVSNDTTLE